MAESPRQENRLAAMTEMLGFTRRPGEGLAELIARYEIVRNRARAEGNFEMSVEGCALQFLRAAHVQPTELVELLLTEAMATLL